MGTGQLQRGGEQPLANTTPQARPLGIWLIILYKFAKAPVMLTLAIWLTAAPDNAGRTLAGLARHLTAYGSVLALLGNWLQAHISAETVTAGAAVAWADAVSTFVEGVLLVLGKAWGEWIVIFWLAVLLVVEAVALEHHPDFSRLAILLVNGAVVGYLLHHRWRSRRAQA